ncbi:MAG: hypothetical protein QXX68_03290 [Candidatus Pacearchaeota archaeon]
MLGDQKKIKKEEPSFNGESKKTDNRVDKASPKLAKAKPKKEEPKGLAGHVDVDAHRYGSIRLVFGEENKAEVSINFFSGEDNEPYIIYPLYINRKSKSPKNLTILLNFGFNWINEAANKKSKELNASLSEGIQKALKEELNLSEEDVKKITSLIIKELNKGDGIKKLFSSIKPKEVKFD